MSKRVTILGAGAWGTAIAQLLADNGHQVTLWTVEPLVADEINLKHTNNRYAPAAILPPTVRATIDIAAAVSEADWLVEAVPVAHLRQVCERIKQTRVSHAVPWLLLSKGIEQHTLLLPHAILADVFKQPVPAAILAGPTFASDVVQRSFTAAMLAATDGKISSAAQELLQAPYFRLYPTDDAIGAQVGGAVKNVIALAAGMARGAGHHENMHAFILTRGFAELERLTLFFGGTRDTAASLAGLGDLMLTASSTTSKNFKAGMLIGQGLPFAQLDRHMPTLPEGINTAQSLNALRKKHALDLPLCAGVYACLFEGASFASLLRSL